MKASIVQELIKLHKLKKLEAIDHLDLDVEPADIKKAKRWKPGICALAVAAKRITGADHAFFFNTTAWLLFIERGVAVRYSVGRKIEKLINLFDHTGKMPKGKYKFPPRAASAKKPRSHKAKTKSVAPSKPPNQTLALLQLQPLKKAEKNKNKRKRSGCRNDHKRNNTGRTMVAPVKVKIRSAWQNYN